MDESCPCPPPCSVWATVAGLPGETGCVTSGLWRLSLLGLISTSAKQSRVCAGHVGGEAGARRAEACPGYQDLGQAEGGDAVLKRGGGCRFLKVGLLSLQALCPGGLWPGGGRGAPVGPCQCSGGSVRSQRHPHPDQGGWCLSSASLPLPSGPRASRNTPPLLPTPRIPPAPLLPAFPPVLTIFLLGLPTLSPLPAPCRVSPAVA